MRGKKRICGRRDSSKYISTILLQMGALEKMLKQLFNYVVCPKTQKKENEEFVLKQGQNAK